MQTEPESVNEEKPRKRSRWRRVGRWLGVMALLPVLVVLAEHVRGRIVLKRVLAERGIRFPGPTERMDQRLGGPLMVSPRVAAALKLASAMEEFSSNPPPALVLLRPAHALPLSAFDWWIDNSRGETDSWETLLSRWDAKVEPLDRIRGVLGRGFPGDAAPASTREGRAFRCLSQLERVHAMVGLRRGRPEAVLEALEGLKAIEEDISGGISFAVAAELRREQERVRLLGVVATVPDEGFLQRLMPQLDPFEIPEGWWEAECVVRDEWLKGLLNASTMELGVSSTALWASKFSDYPPGTEPDSGRSRLLGSFLELLDSVAEPAKERVLLPVWRFGWGDLAIAEFVREWDRHLGRLRQVVKKKSWQEFLVKPERGWYRRWLSGYVGWVGMAGDLELKVKYECECQTEVGLSAAGIGLERYRLKYGEYPERLEQLVPEFMPAVPTDWFCGEPLRYRRDEARGFRLYGVGRNGVDDGGKGFGDSWAGVALFAGSRFSMQSLWADDVVWPVRGTEEQRRKAMEEQEKRLKELANAYGRIRR